jgi:hypothetical protein
MYYVFATWLRRYTTSYQYYVRPLLASVVIEYVVGHDVEITATTLVTARSGL